MPDSFRTEQLYRSHSEKALDAHRGYLQTSLSENPLARKPNYNFEKRSKELSRQAKRDSKREEKLRRKREAETEPAPPAQPPVETE
jgi:hypothetical protein